MWWPIQLSQLVAATCFPSNASEDHDCADARALLHNRSFKRHRVAPKQSTTTIAAVLFLLVVQSANSLKVNPRATATQTQAGNTAMHSDSSNLWQTRRVDEWPNQHVPALVEESEEEMTDEEGDDVLPTLQPFQQEMASQRGTPVDVVAARVADNELSGGKTPGGTWPTNKPISFESDVQLAATALTASPAVALAVSFPTTTEATSITGASVSRTVDAPNVPMAVIGNAFNTSNNRLAKDMEQSRSALLAFHRRLQLRREKRERLIIHQNQSGFKSTSSFASMLSGILIGLSLVACMMKIGIFVP